MQYLAAPEGRDVDLVVLEVLQVQGLHVEGGESVVVPGQIYM